MSIVATHKCPGCGLAQDFIVDNGMILRIPSQKEEDERRRAVLSWKSDIETHRERMARVSKETEEILKGWPSEQKYQLIGLLRDLWAWLTGHTNVTPGGPTEPPTDLRSVCPRTGKVRDGDLKYAGSCGGWQCTHHTCTGASCSHCGGTGRCPEKVAEKK